MCGCTLYDSPTCGHSWISMSQPCGYLSDLINCPYRQTYQTLIAPPYTCPTCNGGFADRETIEMIQGPWGCNQLIRSHLGGSHSISGQWGNTALMSVPLAAPAITRGPMIQGAGFSYDHRLTGPHPILGSLPMYSAGPLQMPANGPLPMICNGYDNYDDGLEYGWDHGDRSKHKHRSKHYHKYRYSSKPSTNCTVM